MHVRRLHRVQAMNDEGKLLMMIRYAGSDAGREAYDSMLVERANRCSDYDRPRDEEGERKDMTILEATKEGDGND